jgi:hypothetical protein
MLTGLGSSETGTMGRNGSNGRIRERRKKQRTIDRGRSSKNERLALRSRFVLEVIFLTVVHGNCDISRPSKITLDILIGNLIVLNFPSLFSNHHAIVHSFCSANNS